MNFHLKGKSTIAKAVGESTGLCLFGLPGPVIGGGKPLFAMREGFLSG